jgi:DNA-binding MarR family transcriptional regulator
MSSPLDLLVLAAIEEGVNTVYRLREHAGLSPGTTSPTIHRLAKEGMIRKGRIGERGKSELVLTAAGRAALSSQLGPSLNSALRDLPPDLESVLRLAALASTRGLRAEAAAILVVAATWRSSRLGKEAALTPAKRAGSALQYANFSRMWEAIRVKTEIRFLKRLATQLRSRH